jgi:hypothetical protein
MHNLHVRKVVWVHTYKIKIKMLRGFIPVNETNTLFTCVDDIQKSFVLKFY